MTRTSENHGTKVDTMDLEVMVGSPSSTATPGGGRVGGAAAASFEFVQKKEDGSGGSISKRELNSNTSDEDTDEEAQLRHQQDQQRSAKMNDEDGDTDEDEKNGIIEEDLPSSTFSLMYVSEPTSRAYWYSFFLWSVQIVITIAALNDSLNEGGKNPASFPPGVSTTVTVAQAAAIPIAVASQPNFIEGIIRFNDFQHEGVVFDRKHPFATNFWSWLVSSVAQILVGIGLLILVFIFTMQSETVFQVCVNLVALFAVANISNNGFVMASKGFVGFEIWKDTRKVAKHKVKRTYQSTRLLQFLYLAIVLAMYGAYAVVVNRQLSGYYHCSSVYMQFSDELDSKLPLLSGIYQMRPNQRLNHRFVYEDESSGDSVFVAYCQELDSFGIAPSEVISPTNGTFIETFDPCSSGVVSQTTDQFDLAKSGTLPWRVQSIRDESFIDLNTFHMQCVDCDQSSCLPSRGTCMDNKCVCLDGRYGMFCQFRAPPEEIVVNANKDPFPAIQSIVNGDFVTLPLNYSLLRADDGSLALAYNRPVYYSTGYEFLLLFTGLRWSIVSPWIALGSGRRSGLRRLNEEVNQTEVLSDVTVEDIRLFLLSSIRNRNMYDLLSQPNVQTFTISEPISPGGELDNGTPLGVHWIGTRLIRGPQGVSVVSIDRTIVYDPIFISATCDNVTNQCENLGICGEDGRCVCSSSQLPFPTHTGALCEKPITCGDVRNNYGSILSGGCFGDYECIGFNDPKCSCLEEYPDAGNFCQFLPCYHESVQANGGCQNNGICSNVTGDCTCEENLFSGKYCEVEIPGCDAESAIELYEPDGCNGRGVCQNNTTPSFCECNSDQFYGRWCQNEIDRCDSTFVIELYPPGGCDNGGQCNTTTGLCDCDDSGMFEGPYCAQTVQSNNTNSTS